MPLANDVFVKNNVQNIPTLSLSNIYSILEILFGHSILFFLKSLFLVCFSIQSSSKLYKIVKKSNDVGQHHEYENEKKEKKVL